MKSLILSFAILLFCFNTRAQALPDFVLVGLNGDTLTLEHLKGKLVYINVFDVGCKPCIAEIPLLNDTQKKLSDVVMIAISPASSKKAQKFKTKYNFKLPIYPDASKLCKKMKAYRYPSHFFVDSAGHFQELYIALGVKVEYDNNGKWNPSEKEWNRMMLEQNQTTIADAIIKARDSLAARK